jgi:hypothetical protein
MEQPNMTPPTVILEKLEEINSWRVERVQNYGDLAEQLGMIYDDIDSGLFGEQAKTGRFYSHVKSIKDNISKPDLDTLNAELEALMQEHHGEE